MKVSELFTYAVVISTQLATALPATSVDEGQDDQATSGVAEFAGALDAHGSSNGNSSSTPANGVGNVNDGDNKTPPPSATGVQPGNKDAGKDIQTSNDGEDNGASDDALSKRGKGGKAKAAKKRGRGRGKKRGKRRVKKGGKKGKKRTRTRARKGGKRGKKGGKRRVRKGGKRGAARANAKNNKNNKNNRKTQSNNHNHRRTDLDRVDEQVRAVPDRFIKRQEQLDSFQPFSGVEDFLQERGADFVFVKRDGNAVADDTADDAAILFARQEGEDSGVFAAAAADDEEAAVFGRDEGSAEAEAEADGAAFEAAEATDDVSASEAAETTDDVSASEAAQATGDVSAFADGNEQQEEPAEAEASATTNDVAAAQEVGALAQEGGDGLDD